MSNYFITSYARRENESYVGRFHKELARAVQDRTGHEIRAVTCRGGDANSALVARADVLVALCSPAYYDDPGCGKDWALFQHRLDFVQPYARLQGPPPARVLVRWRPADPPGKLPRAPVLCADPLDDYARRGLDGIIATSGWNSGDYRKALRELAARVCAGHEHRPPGLSPQSLPDPPQAFPLARAVPGPRAADLTAPAPAPPPHPPSAADRQQPRVFISYAHSDDQPGHGATVLALAELLRQRGINARTDHAAAEEPQIWRQWMQDELNRAQYIITVASPAYRRRSELRERAGVGHGVTWEVGYVLDEVYAHPQTWVKRILRVVLPPYDRDALPVFPGSGSATYYRIDPATGGGALDALVRYLKRGPAPS
ncbi:hypothetical protein DI272_32115 [Streptomyces sp. Act143]|uniref:toll/interleukin-1 receptor domain-containing protein n=1 Tax=Streptomyces sp. Act143 TaxID=2200760 RepID=UPI000D681259|nr:toll/interleukin-1 receptor domain-containing protein [Streptomyces sp. Act143]PWI18273.1 hypothetical protein DI272_32115 [Streptomyces sp. Act143]